MLQGAVRFIKGDLDVDTRETSPTGEEVKMVVLSVGHSSW